MTQRRRMSRAQVERTPGREVLRGPRADVLIIDDPWTPTTPPVDRAAVDAWWGDERLRARLERLAMTPAEFRREMQGTFPDPVRPPPLPPEAVAMLMRLEGSRMYPARPEDARGLNPGTIIYRGQVYDRAPLDEARRRAAEPVRIGPVAAMRWGDGPDGFALSREALLAEMARYGSAGRSDDYTDALALAWQSAPDAWVRRAAIERRAVERTGRVLVAWLIGRWRR